MPLTLAIVRRCGVAGNMGWILSQRFCSRSLSRSHTAEWASGPRVLCRAALASSFASPLPSFGVVRSRPPSSSGLLMRHPGSITYCHGHRPDRTGRTSSSSSLSSSSAGSSAISVDVGILTDSQNPSHEAMESQLYNDAVRVTQEAAYYVVKGRQDPASPPLELSVVLCDDRHIRELNREWRGVDKATDVLAFEMNDGVDDSDGEFVIERDDQPVVVLGDVVISLDTALRQAEERGHTLVDECRILMVHGVLHLLGYDHEHDAEEAKEMQEAEVAVLEALGWARGENGSSVNGLISMQQGSGDEYVDQNQGLSISEKRSGRSDVKLICLDMDGTLLDSNSCVLESSVEALHMAMKNDIKVILATGKARPAAIKAMEGARLMGDTLVVSTKTPGIFLQGLQVYGHGGRNLVGGSLDMEVAKDVLLFAKESGISVTCFLGDECVAPKVTKELEELHHRYYEPYPSEMKIEDILRGPSIRKILMMHDDPDLIQAIRPGMDHQLRSTDACTMMAVETMLEIVPRGYNKGTALKTLLADMDGISIENVMAIGDGENDLEMIVQAGVGVAMGNAVNVVKEQADVIVASNNEDGIYQAITTHIH
jgi:rRNA maturation RNase YbeY